MTEFQTGASIEQCSNSVSAMFIRIQPGTLATRTYSRSVTGRINRSTNRFRGSVSSQSRDAGPDRESYDGGFERLIGIQMAANSKLQRRRPEMVQVREKQTLT
jgi:hypothetical protein